MRDVKFRFWDKVYKKMKYDYYAVRADGKVVTPDCYYDSPCYEKVEEMIPMQYTGLKDKNGKEIYEGDIVKYGEDIYKVIWYSGAIDVAMEFNSAYTGFAIQRETEFEEQKYDEITGLTNLTNCPDDHVRSLDDGARSDDLEIIGNIYENSKLLERK